MADSLPLLERHLLIPLAFIYAPGLWSRCARRRDADLERRRMIEARIAAAKQVMQDISKECQARMPFRSKQQQAPLRTRSRMEAALREVVAKSGMSMLQLTCMHDLGITVSLNLSLQDKELLIDTPQWQTLLKAEIQNSKNKLDDMAKKQTRQCEHQAKRKEAREYLRDKKGPRKFCGNMHSSQAPTELVLGMPLGVMWMNQGPTETTEALTKKIHEEVPSVEIQRGGTPHPCHSGSAGQRGSSPNGESPTIVEMENCFAVYTTALHGSPPKPLPPEKAKQPRRIYTAPNSTGCGQHPKLWE